MGKMYKYLAILTFIDILFLVTGQLILDSPGSVILNTILHPSQILDFNFWKSFISSATSLASSTTGIAALIATVAVVVGFVSGRDINILYIPMAISLSLLIGDWIAIFNYLYNLNIVLATVVFVPVLILFTFTIVEWVRGGDN